VDNKIKLYFDDGLLDTYLNAFPICQQYGVAGILSIVTGYVGKKIDWEDHIGLDCCMNVQQIKEMISQGWTIASHSVTHRNLTNLSGEELRWELEESKNWIIKNLEVQPIEFVPPYGKYKRHQKSIILQHYQFFRSNSIIDRTFSRLIKKKYAVFHKCSKRELLKCLGVTVSEV